jgi:adenosylhomocysteine nucleosidase
MIETLSLSGRRILFVMACEPEYGPALRSRISPVMTGVGPIEAAIETTRALQALTDAGTPPDLVCSLGSAGSRTCRLGEVYQVASIAWRDIDASPLGFARGTTPFADHPVVVPLRTPIAQLPSASLSTGANVVTGDHYAAIDADMVDMESFAVWRACHRFGVEMIGLRGISDGPGELAGLDGWTELLGHLDEKLAEAVDMLAESFEARS